MSTRELKYGPDFALCLKGSKCPCATIKAPIMIWRDAEGRFHSEKDDQPGVVSCDGLAKWWYCHGELHREAGEGTDLPAIEFRDPDGGATVQIWCKHNMLHREDGKPAVIAPKPFWDVGLRYRGFADNASKAKKVLAWFVEGDLHREGDLPAMEVVEPDGKVVQEEYFLHGKRHRDDDKPARVVYAPYPKQVWLYDNKKHRAGGLPAKIYTDADYRTHYEWWEHGEFIREEEGSESTSAALHNDVTTTG